MNCAILYKIVQYKLIQCNYHNFKILVCSLKVALQAILHLYSAQVVDRLYTKQQDEMCTLIYLRYLQKYNNKLKLDSECLYVYILQRQCFREHRRYIYIGGAKARE